jgi:hypothetical protein
MMEVMDHDYLPIANNAADWLRGQGHAALVEPTDQEGVHVITFRTRSTTLTLVAYENDPTFLHVRGYFSLPDGVTDELAVLRLAAGTQMKRKVVKVGVLWEGRGATFEVEEYLEKPGVFDGHVWRAVSIIEETSKGFFDEIRAIVPSPAERFIDDLTRELGISGDGR